MRISDWSSDVCSSDLGVAIRRGRQQAARRGAKELSRTRAAALHPGGRIERSQAQGAAPAGRAHAQALRGERRHGRDRTEGSVRQSDRSDRKSVAEGKSVSVSVDLGGRRIIKKKQ